MKVRDDLGQPRESEKAYAEIPPQRLLGWIKVRRLGAPAVGGWSFEIPDDETWQLVYPDERRPTRDVLTYMNEELGAWRGVHTIPGRFDFAT